MTKTCGNCKWPEWVNRHQYYGSSGWCFNPLSDRIDETGVRFARKIAEGDSCAQWIGTAPKEPNNAND